MASDSLYRSKELQSGEVREAKGSCGHGNDETGCCLRRWSMTAPEAPEKDVFTC